MNGPVTYTTTQAVEAWQVDEANVSAVAAWCGGAEYRGLWVLVPNERGDTAAIGDYVMKGCTGHFSAISAETLAEHYTRADP